MPRKPRKGFAPLVDPTAPLQPTKSKSNANRRLRSASGGTTGGTGLSVLDEETRQALKLARLEALEADNFVDGGAELGGIEDEDFYVDDETSGQRTSAVRPPSGRTLGSLAPNKGRIGPAHFIASVHPSTGVGGGGGGLGGLGKTPRLRKIQDVLAYELNGVTNKNMKGARNNTYASTTSSVVVSTSAGALAMQLLPPFEGSTLSAEHCLHASVGLSKIPATPLCAVCGFTGSYKCTRCGAKYCCTKCRDHHLETRCKAWGGGRG